ncbi:MAG: Mor transcription activator family protein [Pseudomonadota bacterium]
MKTRGVPPTVQEVIDVVGEDKALALMEQFARQRLTIPVDPPCVHPFLNVLTPEEFIELCFRCGGWQWQIPAGEHLKLNARNRELTRLRQQGAKIAELVQRYQLTETRIFQILKEQQES